jgi:hypothetical protein
MKVKDFLQHRNGRLFVPILTLRKGKRRVVIVGVIHLATSQFFERIQALLEEYEAKGYIVLHEAIADSSSMARRSHSKSIYKKAMYKNDTLMDRFEGLGIMYQTRGIHVKSTWVNADQYSETLKRDRLPRITDDSILKSLDRGLSDVVSVVHNILLPLFDPEHQLNVSRDLLERRNEYAVEMVLRYTQYSSVITFWGAAHVSGIRAGLETFGYELEEAEWVEAVSRKDLPVSSRSR